MVHDSEEKTDNPVEMVDWGLIVKRIMCVFYLLFVFVLVVSGKSNMVEKHVEINCI